MRHKMILVGTLIFVLVLISACTLNEPRITSTTVNKNEKALLSRLMGIGDDIMAGYQSAALVEPHQRNDFLALIARQGETPNFQQPYIHYPGLGSESYAGYGILELKYLDNPETPNTVVPDPVIDAIPFSDYPDFDPTTNPFIDDSVKFWPYPYNNLAVPGIYVDDVLHAVSKLRSRSKSGLLDVILRNPLPDPYGFMSAFEQLKVFHPSLVLCWIGTYDILSYAMYSAINPVTSPPTSKEDFARYFSELMDSLKSTKAAVVVANIPDILDMPYFNTVSRFVIDTVTNMPAKDANGNPIPLVGTNESDLILLPAKAFVKRGYGLPSSFPNSNGKPLPDDVILDPAEQQTVKDLIEGFNTVIDSVCLFRQIPVVDMHGFFKEINDGYSIAGLTVTNKFITGGFYSLDGVHPSDLGHALIANQWLQVINNTYRMSVPLVNIIQAVDHIQYSDSLLVQP